MNIEEKYKDNIAKNFYLRASCLHLIEKKKGKFSLTSY